jgi:Trypsin-like serine proteases, typically periplasmic, contain C-terminal PDZ domain
MWQKYRIWLISAVFSILFLIIGILIGSTFNNNKNEISPKRQQDLVEFSDAFAKIAERVNPSVVNITCTEAPEGSEQKSKDEGRPDPNDRYGFGSGLIIDSQGDILTSNHVIEGARKIEVKLSDNRAFTAKLVGQDRETDLALIQVHPERPLPAAVLGDSDRIRAGQWVMAIGNPFVYDHTVTVGVISALHRKLGTTIFDNFIQTDAAINFGNSGGPLLNIKGEVIGINTLISSQGTGIGFSIPINTAKEIIPQLKTKGKVVRGFLGLVPQDITAELQKSMDLPTRDGVLISSIQKDGPADHAGLHRYDVIVELEGQKVTSEDVFRRIIAQKPPGRKIQLKVIREKKTIVIQAQVGERPTSSIPAEVKEPQSQKN